MNGKLVSVVIPSCNDGIYLESAIRSILTQTYKDIEVIIVDSSDDIITLNILKKYANRIKCYYLPKKGVAAALNFGLSQITGEYVARMDADDISLPQRISKQVEFLEINKDISVLGTQCNVIDENGEIIDCIAPGYFNDSEIKAKFIFENCIMHPTVMMRSELINAGWRYDEEHYAEDIRLWMQMACKGVGFSNLKEHLLQYRRSGKNMSSDSSKVAPSVAISAKEYAETMFRLEKDKYQSEDFTRPYYCSFIRKTKTEYIVKQLELLNEIYKGNEKRKLIEPNILVKELNNRWKWVYGKYGQDITYLCEKEVFCPKVDNTTFFLKEIMNRLHINNEEDLVLLLKDILTVNEKFAVSQRHECKSFVIYGMGKRGKRILDEYEKRYMAGNISWKLIAVADSKEIETICFGKQMVTINQNQLVELNPDIVLVSSDKYYREICLELREKGIKSRILDSNWIL